MSTLDWLQPVVYLVALLLLVKPLGGFMARVYGGERTFLHPVLAPVERLFYRAAAVKPDAEMTWKTYAAALLVFNLLGFLAVYVLQRLQGILPLNPQGLAAVSPDSSFNTAVSFATNTNWQGYGGETTMSYLTQMLALTVQNFVSAATGMAVLIALTRGIARHTAQTVGNFWVDMTRSIALYPAAARHRARPGCSFRRAWCRPSTPLSPRRWCSRPWMPAARLSPQQVLAVGPAASQIAIKQLGTNGGGFFNVNSAHPFENPTPLSNFLELLAILLIPAALCYTFGKMVGDTRQGWAILAAMTIIFVVLVAVTVWAEQGGNPRLAALGVDQVQSATNLGGNMEGKEVRFGVVNSALWATATTAASNGSVNAMHDSFMPLGGLAPLWLIQLGEIIFGGVGSGLYGMLAFVIVAVFVAGLMVGRTPEYLGKKIEAHEMKMASLILLIPILAAKIGTAVAVLAPGGVATIFNPGAHGFSEVLYAFSSAAGNNGSAFAGLGANTLFYNTTLGIVMLISRYWLAIPALAIAGSLVSKKKIPAGAGTLPTHTPLFVGWLIGVIVIVGALSFIPALGLGPIVEHLMLTGR